MSRLQGFGGHQEIEGTTIRKTQRGLIFYFAQNYCVVSSDWYHERKFFITRQILRFAQPWVCTAQLLRNLKQVQGTTKLFVVPACFADDDS